MASGVAALVRHLPAGSPATFYCIQCLVDKANKLCGDSSTLKADDWKNWQGGPEPCKKILELLLRLISLVDIQVNTYICKFPFFFFLEHKKQFFMSFSPPPPPLPFKGFDGKCSELMENVIPYKYFP